jgi:uncharacterized membrane protein YdbT with pleckstrin-like domain
MDLEPGERVIFQGHPSWRAILGFYLKGLLLVILAGGIAAAVTGITDDEVKGGTVTIVVIAALALMVLVGLIKRIATVYSITTHRLHIKRGIVARHVQQTRLERVQNVNIEQSVIQRILQVGTVDFDTAGSGDSDFSFIGVSQPEKVMEAVGAAQREHAAEGGRPGAGQDL